MAVMHRRLLSSCFLQVFLLTLTLAVLSHAADSSYRVYVGTYTDHGSQGIYVFRFDPVTGEPGPLELAAETQEPSFLAVTPNRRFLYAVNEVEMFEGKPSGAISAYSIDPATGKLNFLQQVPSMGGSPAYVTTDKTGRYLLVANYGGGNIAVFPIGSDGKLGADTAFDQHHGSSVNRERQSGPHAHAIQLSNDNRFVLSADLGLDEILVYRFDAAKGTLTPNQPPFAKVAAGAGPRHVAFSPNGKFVYVVDEMGSTVTVFSYDAKAGTLHERQTISTLPKDFTGDNTTAEILTDESGGFLYVSNRGDDSIVVYAIDHSNGKLSLVERVSTQGKTPRNFVLDPTGRWLFAANQDSNDIVLFHVDPHSGRLTPASKKIEVSAPVDVIFVPEKENEK